MQFDFSISDYKILRPIGRGGFGNIHLAEEIPTKKQRALKQISLSNLESSNDRYIELATQEATLTSQFNNPFIVKVFGHFIDPETKTLNIVMDYYEGGDLQKFVTDQQGSIIEESRIGIWVTQLVLAVQFLHNNHILHRDIKAQNVFLTKNQKVLKLGDFGVAKFVESSGGASTQIGTPMYSAPEFIDGKSYTEKSDAWSIGVLVYFLAALQLPFTSKNLLALGLEIKNADPKPVPDIYSEDLKDFIKQLLMKSPADRMGITRAFRHPFVLQSLTLLTYGGLQDYKDGHEDSGYHSQTNEELPVQKKSSPPEKPIVLTNAQIFEAFEKNNTALIIQWLSLPDGAKMLLRARTDNNETIAHKLALSANSDMFEFLMRHTAQEQINNDWFDVLDVNKNSALHIATARGQEKMVKALLTGTSVSQNRSKDSASVGANPNLLGGLGNYYNQLTQKIGEDVASKFRNIQASSEFTALHIAALFGYSRIAISLIIYGANPCFRTKHGEQPIHFAALSGSVKIVEFLLSKKSPDDQYLVSINETGKNNRTPLMYAIANGKLEVVKYLLGASRREKLDFDIRQTSDGSTAMHLAAQNGNDDAIRELLKRGAFIDPQRRNGITPLGDAVSNKRVSTVELLLNERAKPSLVTPPLYVVKGRDRGRAAWHFVVVNIEKYRKFIQQTQGGPINVGEFGKIVESGWGENPPPDVEARIKKEYTRKQDGDE